MKKIIALILAIMMMAVIAVPAFADEPQISYTDKTFAGNNEAVGGTVITYGASQAYTVTIPMSISLDNKTAEAAISLSDYSLSPKKVLNIYIDSSMAEANYTNKNDEKWYLFEDKGLTTTGATDVEYQVYVKGKNEAPNTLIPRNGTTVIISADTVENANAVTETLVFTTAGTSQVASFTDTISFTAKIEDPTQA